MNFYIPFKFFSDLLLKFLSALWWPKWTGNLNKLGHSIYEINGGRSARSGCGTVRRGCPASNPRALQLEFSSRFEIVQKGPDCHRLGCIRLEYGKLDDTGDRKCAAVTSTQFPNESVNHSSDSGGQNGITAFLSEFSMLNSAWWLFFCLIPSSSNPFLFPILLGKKHSCVVHEYFWVKKRQTGDWP